MKKMKTLFLSRITKLKISEIYNFGNLPYTKVILLYSGVKDIDFKLPKKISIIKYTNFIDLNKKINEIYKNNTDFKIIPYFGGDTFSKYSIKSYNKTFGEKVDYKIFKEKDKMTDFLGEIAQKKYEKYSYRDLVKIDYNNVIKNIGNYFIIKPTNASSSTNTFKIKSSEEFENIKAKLAKTYDYVLEEYIGGKLFSLDFFFDGKNIYLLCFVREVAMIDIIEENKFSQSFNIEYGEELNKHFNFVLPIRYNHDFGKISKTEFKFLDKIKTKLSEINYKGFIHLEYKYDKKENKIGFIEWGARLGWSRLKYIKKIYNTDIYRVPYYLLVEKDNSKFMKLKKGIFCFKEKEYNINLVGIKTNFVNNINYIELLKKSGSMLKTSFKDFILSYYKDKFGIKIDDINFIIKHSKNYNFYPFYKNNSTRFDYFIELDDKNFKLFKKKKFKIIEQIFFHNYNK